MRPVQLCAWLCLAGPLALAATARAASLDEPEPAANATLAAIDEEAADADWSLGAALAKLDDKENAGADGAANRTQKSAKKVKQRFLADCLQAHNKLRRLHKVPELIWDNKLAAFAAKRSRHMADSDGKEFGHPPGLPFGENLFWHSNARTACELMVRGWYDEIKLYSFARPSFSAATGHFTQLVWRTTKRLGCATAVSKGKRGGVFLTCNYDPPGNYLGEFVANVPPVARAVEGAQPAAKPAAPAAPVGPVAPLQPANNARGLGEATPANATSASTTAAPAAVSTSKPKKKANRKKANKKKGKPKEAKKKSNKKNKKKGPAKKRKPKKTDSPAAASSADEPISSTQPPAANR